MIILGDRHKFSDIESTLLKDIFSTIDHISYKDTDGFITIDNIESCLRNRSISIILLNTQARIPDELLSYLTKLEQRGIQYISTESFFEQYLQKCYIPEDQTNITFLENIKPYTTFQYLQKRFIDYSGILLLGILSIPIIPYTIYRIKKESPGPVLFKQRRVGLNGKEFICYKFRSMDIDAEKNGVQFAIEDDPRVFNWGLKMRKTRIDELPQLWNILKGEMHLIGPRPERKYWIDKFEEKIPYYHERHLIKPGITGWAQVNYPYGANTEDAKQKLMYDLYYIKYWNFCLEIKTSFMTLMVMMREKGV